MWIKKSRYLIEIVRYAEAIMTDCIIVYCIMLCGYLVKNERRILKPDEFFKGDLIGQELGSIDFTHMFMIINV